MLTIQYIIKRTPQRRKDDSKYVRILRSKAGYDAEGHAFFAAQTQSTHTILPNGRPVRDPHRLKYVTVITILDPRRMYAKVSCSCSDFMYRWETALHRKGAADIEYSNGEMPTTTNPELLPVCCKHLVCVYDRIRDRLGQSGK